jgi:hypothetical protein
LAAAETFGVLPSALPACEASRLLLPSCADHPQLALSQEQQHVLLPLLLLPPWLPLQPLQQPRGPVAASAASASAAVAPSLTAQMPHQLQVQLLHECLLLLLLPLQRRQHQQCLACCQCLLLVRHLLLFLLLPLQPALPATSLPAPCQAAQGGGAAEEAGVAAGAARLLLHPPGGVVEEGEGAALAAAGSLLLAAWAGSPPVFSAGQMDRRGAEYKCSGWQGTLADGSLKQA